MCRLDVAGSHKSRVCNSLTHCKVQISGGLIIIHPNMGVYFHVGMLVFYCLILGN